MQIADVFYLLGSIFMSLLIFVLVMVLVMMFYLKKKVSDIQRAFQTELQGGLVSWIIRLLPRRR